MATQSTTPNAEKLSTSELASAAKTAQAELAQMKAAMQQESATATPNVNAATKAAISKNEAAQEQELTLATGVVVFDMTKSQLAVYNAVVAEFRVVDTIKTFAEKGLNQQLKAAIAGARNRTKGFHSDAVRAKNEAAMLSAEQQLLRLEELEKSLRFVM